MPLWEALLKLVGICTNHTVVSWFLLKKKIINYIFLFFFFNPTDNFIGKMKLLCVSQIHNKHKIYLPIVVQVLKMIPKVENK